MNSDLLERLQRIKCIYSDIDGTICNDNQDVSKETKDVIRELNKKKYIFGLISGRHRFISYEIIKKIKPNGYYIGLNGALVTNLWDDNSISQVPIEQEVAKELILFLIQNSYAFILFTENLLYYFTGHNDLYDEYMGRLLADKKFDYIRKIKISHYNEFINQMHQMFCFCIPKINGPEKIQRLKDRFNQNSKLDITYCVTTQLLDIRASNIDKGIALQKVISSYNLTPKDLLVFGNSYNDIQMFKIAGVSVAMKQANDDVKIHADVVTEFDNNNSGVARFIEKYFLN